MAAATTGESALEQKLKESETIQRLYMGKCKLKDDKEQNAFEDAVKGCIDDMSYVSLQQVQDVLDMVTAHGKRAAMHHFKRIFVLACYLAEDTYAAATFRDDTLADTYLANEERLVEKRVNSWINKGILKQATSKEEEWPLRDDLVSTLSGLIRYIDPPKQGASSGMYAAMDALNLHDGREIEFQRLITGQSQMQRMKQLDEEADKFVACVYEWLKEEERPPEEPTIFKKKCPMRPDVGKNPESGGINMKEFVETVPSADGNLLYEHVLSGLKSDEALPVTILTGVSGAGKTKIAYDVSVEYGFPIMCRVYDQGALRETWEDLQIFLRLSEQIFEGRSVNDDFVRRYCIAAQKLLLMSFLEWAIQAGELIQQHMQKDEREDERLLRRNLLVCQRNGTAERMVCVLFKANLLNANQTDITKRNPDVLNEYVATVYNALKKRADSILPKQRLLWTFDEAQVLIDYPNTIRELPEERKPDVDYDRTTHYHLLSMAINYLFTASEICHSHVILCGTGLKLTANSMATVSPLQGYTKEFRIATRFTHSEVRRLLSGYLKPTALEAFKDEILDWWSGRPLYCSNLLYYLHHLHKEETIQQMTRNCQKRVLEDAIERMRKLTCVRLQKRIDTPQDLLLKLYHSLIMGEWSPEVEVADHCPAVHQARCLSYG